jgi:hypothetical protein
MARARTVPRAVFDDDRVPPEVILPAQLAPSRATQPERALLRGLLLDAVDCLVKHRNATTAARRRLFTDAEAWIFGDDQSDPFSFEHVCEHLAIDAGCLRGALQQWRDRQPSRGAASIQRRPLPDRPALRAVHGARAA